MDGWSSSLFLSSRCFLPRPSFLPGNSGCYAAHTDTLLGAICHGLLSLHCGGGAVLWVPTCGCVGPGDVGSRVSEGERHI